MQMGTKISDNDKDDDCDDDELMTMVQVMAAVCC